MAFGYSRKFNYHADLVVADATELPFIDSCFDCVIALASYHHIQDKKNRVKAFGELRRVLKPGAEFFLTVWNRWQPEFWFKGKEVIVPWKTKNRQYDRYHYLYTYHEIEKLLTASGLNVIKSYAEFGCSSPVKYFSRNICVLGRAGYSVP
ncbi:MAG: class I SAM-dependent methyltransferase [Chloroflexi bacterium]|nr:class I SAM-dependent methyltransferase [Chloroflexota bacterium]